MLQSTLNFSKNDKEKLLALLKQYPEKPTKEVFEEFRCKINESTVTLYNSGKLSIQGPDAEQTKNIILHKLNLKQEFCFGIDESGRGENFGPMIVSGVLGDTNKLRELRDSKKISGLKAKLDLVNEHSLAQALVSLNAEYVDKLRKSGLNLNKIEAIIMNHLIQAFQELEQNKALKIEIDGNPLKGVIVKQDAFLPKGDDLNPVIGSASVVAKFYRELSSDKKKRLTWNSKEKQSLM